jgi:hypothetical protein
MTRRSITILALVAVTCLVVPGCAAAPTEFREERPSRLINLTGEDWAKAFYCAIAIYLIAQFADRDDDRAYVGIGGPPRDDEQPAYCADPVHKQRLECS